MTSLWSPSRTRGDKQNHRAWKCLCWHCVRVWTAQGEQLPGVGQGGYYVNSVVTASSRMLVDSVFLSILVIINSFGVDVKNFWSCALGRKVWCAGSARLQIVCHLFICRGALHSFKLNTCLREIMVWLRPILRGRNLDQIYPCCLYCGISPSHRFAFIPCMLFQIQLWKLNRQQWDTSIKISHIMLLYSYTVCVLF